MPKRRHQILVASVCYLFAAVIVAVYWIAASHPPDTLDLQNGRRFIRLGDRNIYWDAESGFRFELPARTFVIDVSSTRTVIGRGYYGDPDYILYVNTESYDKGIPAIDYLAAQHEAAALQGPSGSTLVFSQFFDQGSMSGVQKVYVREFPEPEVEEQYVFANDGTAIFLRFQYPMSVRESLEAEMVWVRSTLRFGGFDV